MKIQDLLEQFCDYSSFIRGYSQCTIYRYHIAINLYCNIGLVENIQDVTRENVEKFFLTGRHERKWDPSSFVTYHKSLLVFFRWCVQKGYLMENPAEHIEMPKCAKKLPSKLSLDQARHLLKISQNHPWYDEFLRERNTAIIAMFLFSGVRRQELLNLECADVDLSAGSIFIRSGKGQKDRYIPMSEDLRNYLQSYILQRTRLKRACSHFFTSFTLDRGFSAKGLSRVIEALKGASELKFSAHKLRHTFATLMLEGGCDIYSLSRMMGHSDISTTTIYLAASPGHLKGQMVKHPLGNL